MKFGGTSVGGASQIRTVGRLVASRLDRRPVVVVSAVSGTTDLLLQVCAANNQTERRRLLTELADRHVQIIDELWGSPSSTRTEVQGYLTKQFAALESLSRQTGYSKQRQDHVVSFGETLSSYIVAAWLCEQGMNARQVIATDIVRTNSRFGGARVIEAPTKRAIQSTLAPLVENNAVPVVTGFIGADAKGRTTTLGRGGSDYSAALVGCYMGATAIEIWTDVDGMFSADPRLVQGAHLLPYLTFKEAAELAAFGAKVLHPKTIEPAVRAAIPVHILNTFRPESPGTVITAQPVSERPAVRAVASRQATLVNLYNPAMLLQEGFLARVLEIFARHHISVDLVSASEVSVSFTLDNSNDLTAVTAELQTLARVDVWRNHGVVSLIGDDVGSAVAMSTAFKVLARHNCDMTMLSMGASGTNISLVMPSKHIPDVVQALHDEFVSNRKETA